MNVGPAYGMSFEMPLAVRTDEHVDADGASASVGAGAGAHTDDVWTATGSVQAASEKALAVATETSTHRTD